MTPCGGRSAIALTPPEVDKDKRLLVCENAPLLTRVQGARPLTTISKSIALSALLLIPSLLSAQQKHSVHVGASAGDTEKSKARELADSADDLREQIGKRANLVLVEHPETAEILITVLDRYIDVRPSGQTNYGGGNTQSHYQSRYILKYRLEAGTFVQDGEYVLAGAFVTWKRMATGVSKDIEKWVDKNAELAEQLKETSPQH